MTRVSILATLVFGVALIVSCSGATAQPTATTQPTVAPAQPTATTQPTVVPAQPTATTQPTVVPVQPTATAVPPTATTAPTKAPATATSQATSQTSSSGQQKINLDDYFPKGPGRDLVLRDCTTCHSFAPVIMGQRPKARWLSLKEDHKDKASGVAPADYDVEFTYLMENFNDTKPEPKLPEWFIKQQPGIGE